jgi:hypothetical protein
MNEENEQPKLSRADVLKNAKNRPSTTRATRRAKTMALIKQVEGLMAMLGPYKREAVQVLVDQLSAMKTVFHNGVAVGEVPDEIIRQKAAIAILEWLEGKPRELHIQMRGDFDDLAEMQRRLQGSPEAKRCLPDSLQAVQGGREIPPALPDATSEEGEPAD